MCLLDALIRCKLPLEPDALDADAPDAYYPYPSPVWLKDAGPTGQMTGQCGLTTIWPVGPASFSQTSWTPGHTTGQAMDVYIIAQVLYLGVHGQAALNHRVARHSASLTKRRRADGPDDGWSGHIDPSFGPSARRLLVRPSTVTTG